MWMEEIGGEKEGKGNMGKEGDYLAYPKHRRYNNLAVLVHAVAEMNSLFLLQ